MSTTEDIIEDSLNDAMLDDDPGDASTDTDTSTADASADAVTTTAEAAGTDDDTSQVAAPSAAKEPVTEQPAKQPEDEFAKKFGIPAQSVTGRENRIPYSRVKKIVEKNEKDTIARITKELEEKYSPQLGELTPKVKDYEERLGRVAQFEKVMTDDPRQFLGMLSGLPAYKEFFDFVNRALETQGKAPGAPTAGTDGTTQPDASDDMPQPDRTLTDGSRVYSMDGLKALMAWQGKQVESRVNKHWETQVDKRFGPMEKAYQSQEYMAKLAPQIDNQIAEARKWPNFGELEAEIVTILNADQQISLEGAYRTAYQKNIVPKLTTDRNKLRTEILAEIKKQPAATAGPAGAIRPKVAPTPGARGTEEVIRASLEEAGLIGR